MKGEKPRGLSSKSDLSNLTSVTRGKLSAPESSYRTQLISSWDEAGRNSVSPSRSVTRRKENKRWGWGRVSALVKGDVSGVMAKGNAQHGTCYDRQHRNRAHGNRSSSRTTAKDFLVPTVVVSSDLVSLIVKALPRAELDSSKQMKSLGI